MMNSQEIETALRLNLDLIVLILNDNAYGMIRWKQAQMEFTDYGLEFGNPDFKKYAESYGAHGHHLEATEDLIPLITECQSKGGVHVINIPIDYSENHRILNVELPERSAKL